MDRQYYRCTKCHALDHRVNWSQTCMIDYDGEERKDEFVPMCIHCHAVATALNCMANALINIATPEAL